MKRIYLIIIAVLFSSVVYSQQCEADFTQTRLMKVSGKTTTMHGHIVYDGGEQLSMIYSDPEGDYFIIDGTKVKINLLKKKAEIDAEKVKAVKIQRATLLNCIAGQWEQAALDNNAETIVNEEDGFRNILIKAKGVVPRGGYSSVDLSYRLTDGALVKMVLEEATGIINTYVMDY